MRKTIELLLRISCILCLTWVNSSCAESTPDIQTKDTATHANQKAEKAVEIKIPATKVLPKQKIEDFDQFYELFTDAVNNDDWNQVISLTQFPFVFRGQLDMEGQIEVSQDEFKEIFPAFLESEAFIDLEGELIPSTFRGLLMTRMETAESITKDSAQIHDFVFEKIDKSWKFVQVYTDLSNIK